MSDYLIWVAEEMEKNYGLTMEKWMEYIMHGMKVPSKYSLENYVKANI